MLDIKTERNDPWSTVMVSDRRPRVISLLPAKQHEFTMHLEDFSVFLKFQD